MHLHHGQPVLAAGAPLGPGRRIMILLHGRNASPESILEVVPRLDRPDVTYLAPTAVNRTWYPQSFLSPIPQNEPALSSALQVVSELFATLHTHGVAPARVVLGGFSQGACLSAEYAVRHAGRYGGVIVWSGGLIGPPGTVWAERGSFSDTPVFLGCSEADPHIPRARVEESAAVFGRLGARVTTRLYPGGGHFVSDDAIEAARTIIDALP